MAELEGLKGVWDRTQLLEEMLDAGQAGVPEPARAFALAGIAARQGTTIVLCPRSRDAETLAHGLGQWMPEGSVELFPAWEVLPGEAISPTLETMGRRIRVLRRLAHDPPQLIVTSVRGILQRVPQPSDDSVVLAEGSELPLDELADRLVDLGYERNYLVERPGEFSVRGGILDVYPPGAQHPVRADFFGDTVSELREFSISSQRSLGPVGRVEVSAVTELRLTPAVRDRARTLAEQAPESSELAEDLTKISEGVHFAGMESYTAMLSEDAARLIDHTDDPRIVVLDPKQCRDRAEEFLAQASQWGGEQASGMFMSLDASVSGAQTIEMWAYRRAEEGVQLDVTGFDEMAGDPGKLADAIRARMKSGTTVVVAAGRLAERAQAVLSESGLGLPVTVPGVGEAAISNALVEKGFSLRDPNGTELLAVVGVSDLFGRRRATTALAPATPARASALLLELAPGDYVVHETYGVGRYHGMVTREVGGVSRDYLIISYHSDDRLYLPTEQLDAITRYTGGESPRLSRLGTAEWEKTKARARKAVEDIAGELIVLYSKRKRSEGFAFSPDTPWQGELESSFPYPETPDQLRAIQDVKYDMEQPVPMDRLVCGDVGFGKTEVAVRAAFKAVQDSKQVAVLVPTTILAQQHAQTFSERFAGFPVRVEQLSRFLTDAQQREVLEGVASGKVDVVIGTHRLIQPDIKFNDLGLLIVDEEHRFGVKHKEQTKKLRESVDVLAMSATPIPRTLEMSLTQIRDLSLIDTPPLDRRPVMTYVGEADARMITAAIRRELARDGQVFFVHNRVRSIRGAARRIAGLVPGARVEIAHGQMSETELEKVMVDVWDGKVDVLVCTTIIESGLDIPAMNTLIVERADLLGLAQLYQLRGRVGRARERAYAYFLYPHDSVLTDEAHERLKILSEFTELGSGFKIALRDLEIRGAGNMLGAAQHGHIAAVGFDLYMKMVTEAVRDLSGQAPEPKIDVTLDLPVNAFIPASYIGRESLRMDAYRQIEKVRSSEDAASLAEELRDRYGELPKPVEDLLTIAEIRAFMAQHDIKEMTVRDGVLKIRPFPELLDSQQVRLRRLHPNSELKEVSDTLLLPAPADGLAAWVLDNLRAILA